MRPLLLSSCLLLACGTSGARSPETCPPGRTLLDDTCVDERVADYVGCVRAQGATLNAESRKRLSADVGYLGIHAGGTSEISEKLEKKYATSDSNVAQVIRGCDELRKDTPADICADTGNRLIECGYAADPGWLGQCRRSREYATCLKTAGSTCAALSLCGFEEISRQACEGAPPPGRGTSGCEATTTCQSNCAGDLKCICTCNGAMAARAANAVGIQNQCYSLHCADCGASGTDACNACFTKHCGSKYDQLCRAQ